MLSASLSASPTDRADAEPLAGDVPLVSSDLADSRLGASRVLALLESAPVRRKFGLAEEDLELVRHWIEEVRIRWGRDQQQRAGLGLPAWSENTWRHGLERLLVGYAMAGNGEKFLKGFSPTTISKATRAKSWATWPSSSNGSLPPSGRSRQPGRSTSGRRLSSPSWRVSSKPARAEAQELQVLGTCFEKLARAAERAGFDQPVELAVVLEQLNRDLSEDYFGSGYLTGGVTFCALKPMRSIPSKVICLLGMNDRSFPRTSPQLSFDLMAQKRQLGDRSSREDDRYLFLETLISARRTALHQLRRPVDQRQQRGAAVGAGERAAGLRGPGIRA